MNYKSKRISLEYIPNIITLLRIVLVLPIIGAVQSKNYELGAYLFIFAGLSDGIDGFLARRFNWGSRFGSIIDPLADKILLMGTCSMLVWNGEIPAWVLLVIVVRDFWVISGAVFYHFFISFYELSPSLISKVNTFMQICLVFLVLVNLGIMPINPNIIRVILMMTVVACVLSWINYTYVWGRKAWSAYMVRKFS